MSSFGNFVRSPEFGTALTKGLLGFADNLRLQNAKTPEQRRIVELEIELRDMKMDYEAKIAALTAKRPSPL